MRRRRSSWRRPARCRVRATRGGRAGHCRPRAPAAEAGCDACECAWILSLVDQRLVGAPFCRRLSHGGGKSARSRARCFFPSWLAAAKPACDEESQACAFSKVLATNGTARLTYRALPSSSQPNFSRALRVTSGLGALVAGNLSRQCHGLQALISATECVMLPAARRSGGSAGSPLESHEPVMNWIDSLGSVRVSIAHNRWSRLVTSTSSSTTTTYFEA